MILSEKMEEVSPVKLHIRCCPYFSKVSQMNLCISFYRKFTNFRIFSLEKIEQKRMTVEFYVTIAMQRKI